MPKIYATIPEKTAADLGAISQKTGKSFSKFTCEMIELGLQQFYKNQQPSPQTTPQEKFTEFNSKTMEYLLRILNISSEIFRKINDEPSKCPGKTTTLKLEEIKNYSKKHAADMQKPNPTGS